MESRRTGWIQLILGCMFSGKSEELQRLLKRHRIAKESVAVFRPSKDTRSTRCIAEAASVNNASEILDRVGDARVVGIDEAQFFGPELARVAYELARRGMIVYVAGLSGTFAAEAWPAITALLPHANDITFIKAVCSRCGDQTATYSQRTAVGQQTELVGDGEAYEARCRNCFEPPPAPYDV